MEHQAKDQNMNDTAGPRTLGSTPHESERKRVQYLDISDQDGNTTN